MRARTGRAWRFRGKIVHLVTGEDADETSSRQASRPTPSTSRRARRPVVARGLRSSASSRRQHQQRPEWARAARLVESRRGKYAALAQLVEHPPCKRKVVSSIPTSGTITRSKVTKQKSPGFFKQSGDFFMPVQHCGCCGADCATPCISNPSIANCATSAGRCAERMFSSTLPSSFAPRRQAGLLEPQHLRFSPRQRTAALMAQPLAQPQRQQLERVAGQRIQCALLRLHRCAGPAAAAPSLRPAAPRRAVPSASSAAA
jgi:hypothetical protein